jgi:hypothetical protein
MCKSFLVENGFNLLPIQTQHEITFKKLQNSSEAELYSCDLDKYVFKESEIFNL